jgi:hypothetical protein
VTRPQDASLCRFPYRALAVQPQIEIRSTSSRFTSSRGNACAGETQTRGGLCPPHTGTSGDAEDRQGDGAAAFGSSALSGLLANVEIESTIDRAVNSLPRAVIAFLEGVSECVDPLLNILIAGALRIPSLATVIVDRVAAIRDGVI